MYTSKHPEPNSYQKAESIPISDKASGVFKRLFIIYILLGALCLIFSRIYNLYSHGVTSPYMTYLCLFPIIIGALPNLFFIIKKAPPKPGQLSLNLYNTGLAAIILSSAMRGIFEIAGTGSVLQVILMIAGFFFLISGTVIFILQNMLLKGDKT